MDSKPDLSVIIVSYNAKYYLHLTLTCLTKIQKDLIIEIIVVDNFSNNLDHEWIQTHFPNVRFILNSSNLGFGKANNIGVSYAHSDNILILNPDTLISIENISFALKSLNLSKDVGAVAVKLIDGEGTFLPESYRSFPSLLSSILKLAGINHFSNYYNGKNTENHIDVLSGACFFIRKEVYDEIGGFDESYFMYGEDIDFSFILNKNKYKILYLEENEIVHFKGKSSLKSNWNYQHAFYDAMLIYWNKNLNTKSNSLLSISLFFIVNLLKILAFIKYTVKAVFPYLFDFILMYTSTALLALVWSQFGKENIDFLPSKFYFLVLPLYSLVTVFSFLLSSMYSSAYDLSNYMKAHFVNFILLLVLYFVLPIEFKYSRAVLGIFLCMSFLVPLIYRIVIAKLNSNSIIYNFHSLLSSVISPSYKFEVVNQFFNHFSSLKLIHSPNTATNMILDVNLVSNSELISQIKSSSKNKSIWLFSEFGRYCIQSIGSKREGYILAPDMNLSIYYISSKILKRFFDIFTSLILVFLPFLVIYKYSIVLKWVFSVLFKNFTWFSVQGSQLKNGIFYLDVEFSDNYLRNYNLRQDFNFIIQKMFIS